MRIAQDIRPSSQMRTRGAALLREVEQTRRPVVLTEKGEAKGVLMDVASYQSLLDATMLLKLLAQGEEDIRRGRTVSQELVFARARARLSKK